MSQPDDVLVGPAVPAHHLGDLGSQLPGLAPGVPGSHCIAVGTAPARALAHRLQEARHSKQLRGARAHLCQGKGAHRNEIG